MHGRLRLQGMGQQAAATALSGRASQQLARHCLQPGYIAALTDRVIGKPPALACQLG